MAFIHCAAKPPRNVRVQQEIHGTAGPAMQPYPLDRPRLVQGGELTSFFLSKSRFIAFVAVQYWLIVLHCQQDPHPTHYKLSP